MIIPMIISCILGYFICKFVDQYTQKKLNEKALKCIHNNEIFSDPDEKDYYIFKATDQSTQN